MSASVPLADETHLSKLVEGVRRGRFSGDDFATLARKIADARSALDRLDPEEINALEGAPMRFEIRDHHADFKAEGFLLSFSKPNFYFHATTAYARLRMKGLAIGKVDYLGRLAMQKA